MAKGSVGKYYDEILDVIRYILSKALKDNPYLKFAEKEVDKLLYDTELTTYKFIVKDWYNGYHFGQKEIYCPWDVLFAFITFNVL